MRRSDREVKDFNQVLEFIREEDVIRLALVDEEGVYIVPVNYGYSVQGEEISFYFHGAKEGRKAKALKAAYSQDSEISFEIDGRHEVVAENGCNASYLYMCLMGKSKLEILEGTEKIEGLKHIMDSVMPADMGNEKYDFVDDVVASTLVCKLTVTNWSCKKH